MPQEMEQLTKLGEDLQAGLHALNSTKEQLKQEVTASAEAKLSRIAEDMATKFQTFQDEQQKLKAAIERANIVATADGADEESREKRSAFVEFLRKGDIRHMAPERVKALSTDSLDNGGYLVPTQSLGMINGRIFETSPLRSIANVISTSAKSVEWFLDDQEAGFAWAGEGDAIAETATPASGRLEIAAHKAIAYPKITEEMAADAAFDMEAWLANKIADKIGRGENTAFVNGNGVSAPRGFLTYTAGTSTYARGSLEQVPMGSTSAITENGLLALQGSLKEPYQARANFVMKRATLVATMQVQGTNAFRFININSLNAANKQVLGPTITLLDKPVVLMDDMPVIASNALSIGYGDFSSGYTVVDRIGLSVRADPYTAPGFIKYYATKRTGGAVTNFEAIKLARMSVS